MQWNDQEIQEWESTIVIQDLKLEVLAQLDKDLGLGIEEIQALSPKALLKLLEDYVSYGLERNMEGMLQGVYKLDLPQGIFEAAMTSANPTNEIAILMLKRALQKVVLRKKFSS